MRWITRFDISAFLATLVEDRYGRGSTLITSQLPIDRWHEHSARIRLLNASAKALSVGLPGREKSSVTPRV